MYIYTQKQYIYSLYITVYIYIYINIIYNIIYIIKYNIYKYLYIYNSVYIHTKITQIQYIFFFKALCNGNCFPSIYSYLSFQDFFSKRDLQTMTLQHELIREILHNKSRLQTLFLLYDVCDTAGEIIIYNCRGAATHYSPQNVVYITRLYLLVIQ